MEAERWCQVPPSQVELENLLAWIECEKKKIGLIDVDVKDGKRRVLAAKPKKRRAATSAVNPEGSDNSDDDAGSA